MKSISTKQQTHLFSIRDKKTAQTKETLKKAYNELIQQKKTPTRYNLHQKTNIAYITINKYFFELNNNFNEVVNG
jgi:uncharacterized FlaG/YvyC family protein